MMTPKPPVDKKILPELLSAYRNRPRWPTKFLFKLAEKLGKTIKRFEFVTIDPFLVESAKNLTKIIRDISLGESDKYYRVYRISDDDLIVSEISPDESIFKLKFVENNDTWLYIEAGYWKGKRLVSKKVGKLYVACNELAVDWTHHFDFFMEDFDKKIASWIWFFSQIAYEPGIIKELDSSQLTKYYLRIGGVRTFFLDPPIDLDAVMGLLKEDKVASFLTVDITRERNYIEVVLEHGGETTVKINKNGVISIYGRRFYVYSPQAWQLLLFGEES